MRIPKSLVIAGAAILSTGVFNFQTFGQDSKTDAQKDADAQKKLNDPAYLEKLKQNGIEFTPAAAKTNAPAAVVKPDLKADQEAKQAAADLAAKQKAAADVTASQQAAAEATKAKADAAMAASQSADAKMAAKKAAAEDAAKQKAEAAEAAKRKISEAKAKKKEAAERAETAKIEARLAAKQKLAAAMEAKHKAAEAKAGSGATVVAKGEKPVPAPALTPGSKEARLAELLQLYKAEKVTPAEYHDQRAKIIAEP